MGNDQQFSSVQIPVSAQDLQQVKELLTELLTSNRNLEMKVSLMHQSQQHNDEKTKLLFERTDAQSKQIATHANTLNIHAFIWKLIGSGALASFGLLSWGYSTLQTLHGEDNKTDRRLIVLEYAAAAAQTREQTQKQQTNGQPK